MAKAGIPSEVLDLCEALGTPEEEARTLLMATYERAAYGVEVGVSSLRAEGKDDIAERNLQTAARDRQRAEGLRDGSITISQELAARAAEREARGHPENFYVELLQNPVFPHE